jgi:hypothetical protein
MLEIWNVYKAGYWASSLDLLWKDIQKFFLVLYEFIEYR